MELQNYSISALLDFGVDRKTMKPWFSFASLTQLLTLSINGMVHLVISRYWEDRFSDDSDVLEVKCEYRYISPDEISAYGFRVDNPSSLPKFTIVTIEGPLNIKIVCESFDVHLEPLREKFPDML